jgi:periplasmic divalent cation tolerance protein
MEVGERIAERLVAERLAACVQISGPITSTYHWKGKIEQEREYVCTAKTSRKNYPEIEKIILELHPYETPEIIATPPIPEDGAKARITNATAAEKTCLIAATVPAVLRFVMIVSRKIFGESVMARPGSVRIAAGFG